MTGFSFKFEDQLEAKMIFFFFIEIITCVLLRTNKKDGQLR